MQDVVMTEWADRVTALVRQSSAVDGIRIIGIDGPSGSGKSTLARLVATRLDCPVIELDDFVSWNDLDGWWPRFDEQVLSPLLLGRDAEDHRALWDGWMRREDEFFAADYTRARADVVVPGA